jgi:anion-transporting  ArsA/GET3 family ATPase
VRWLTIPYRSRLATMASRPFYQVADRILGRQFLEDIAEFFMLFQTMHDGFVERARAVERLLGDRRTAFMVVTTPEASPAREAEFFLRALGDRGLPFGALIVNRVLPAVLDQPHVLAVAERLVTDAPALARTAAAAVDAEPALLGQLLAQVGENVRNFAQARLRERELEASLGAGGVPLVQVPWLDRDTADVEGILQLGDSLWSNTP